MPLKVIHILGSLAAGGAETLIYNIIRYWGNDSFEHSVYYLRDIDTLKDSFDTIGVYTKCLNWKSELSWTQLPSLIEIFRNKKPHIVHSHLWWGNYIVGLAANCTRVPVYVETIHSTHVNSKLGTFVHRLCRTPHTYYTDNVICISQRVKDNLIKNYRQPAKRLVVINNGVKNNLPVKLIDKKQFRHSLNIPTDLPILISVGNLIPIIKGYEIYLDALRILVNRGKKFFALVVGAEQKHNLGFKSLLEERVREYKLDKHVLFTGYRTDIPEVISAADIFVLSSVLEGGPIVLLEAMREAKPVISTRVGLAEELVVPDKTGFIAEPGNPHSLASAIERMLDQPEKWEKMGKKGREIFEEGYTLDKTIDQYAGLYKKLLTEKGLSFN